VRFVCDQDVDVRVAAVLRGLGHEAWTAAEAGLSRASDDELSFYAITRKAALLSHDIEFSERRRRNVIGRHIFLRCNEWDAAAILERYAPEFIPILERHADVWVRLSTQGPALSFDWQ